MSLNVFGYAAQEATSSVAPFHFERRDPRPTDVVIQITYCGVCHSDLRQARNEWGNSIYPMVPGHEIVERVESVRQIKCATLNPYSNLNRGCRKILC